MILKNIAHMENSYFACWTTCLFDYRKMKCYTTSLN